MKRTYHNGPHHVADAEHVLHLELVHLPPPDILPPHDAGEGVRAYLVVDDQDRNAGLPLLQPRYPREHDGADRREPVTASHAARRQGVVRRGGGGRGGYGEGGLRR